MTTQGVQATNPTYTHKVVFLGDLSTGKTSIINKFVYGTFNQQHHPTIGVDLISKTLALTDYSIRFQLWDTAGQERFRAIIPSYIRDSSVAIIIFDLVHRPSFATVNKWIDDVREQRGTDVLVILVGNKCDLFEERVVTTEEAQEKADELGVSYFETSAKDGTNIQKLFIRAAQDLPQLRDMPADASRLGETIHVTPQNVVALNGNKSCSC